MDKIIKESFIYKIIISISNWFNKICSNSLLVNIFLTETKEKREEIYKNSLISKIFKIILNFFRKIAKKIKLDKLLQNSIFVKPIIWVTFVVALTPFLPTMAVLLLVLLSLGSLFLKAVTQEDFKFRYSNMNIWILLLVLVYFVSAVTSISKLESRNIFMLITAFILFYFILINSVDTKSKLKMLIYVFIISATCASIYGIYQYKFGDVYSQAWIDEDKFEDIRMRVYSTFENPNVFGEYLILVIPIIAALIFDEKGFMKKLILFGMFAINCLALIYTFSRGCWLGIIFGIAILAIIKDRRFILLGVIALLASPLILPETIINRFMSIGDMTDSSTSYRVYIWFGTIAMLKDYWLSGVGLGNTSFNRVYPIYSYNGVVAPHSHNLYLQLMAEHGIVGFIIFIEIIYNFYKEAAISMSKRKNIVLAGIISGMAGFLLESMFDYTWYNYRVILIFWTVIALGSVMSEIDKKEE